MPKNRDILRKVRLEKGYTLTTWDTHTSDHYGKSCLGYEFKNPDGKVLFTGEDFYCSPMDAIDSDNSLRALLGFLTLRPGDTDDDYFKDYTAEQMAFAEGDAEMLGMYALEFGPDEEDGSIPFEDIDD